MKELRHENFMHEYTGCIFMMAVHYFSEKFEVLNSKEILGLIGGSSMYIYTYVHTYVRTCMNARIHTYIHTYLALCVFVS